MHDIVLNLLSLSSEIRASEELIRAAIEPVRRALDAEFATVLRAGPPDWSTAALAGAQSESLPFELAADAHDRGISVRQGRWIAAPLTPANAGERKHTAFVLLAKGATPEPLTTSIVQALSALLALVGRAENAAGAARRLEATLKITHDWHQTNDMATLLKRMAETATKLFDADRASIFLWDKANRVIVGRPALGMTDGELRLPDDAGIVGQVIQTGEPRRVNDALDADEVDRAVDRRTGYHTKTLLCVPLLNPEGVRLGAFELLNKRTGPFTAADEQGLSELASYAAIALENTQQFAALVAKHEKLVEQAAGDRMLLGENCAIRTVRSVVERVANTDLAVLVLGENGTGKEVVARSLHFMSRRRPEPFVAVNCAALSETLLESELFGHEKGAFTDARETRVGKFELAAGGTIFLDEIGDMSLAGQSKLLRVLEEKIVVRVGGNTPIHTDVRVIAATNQNLNELLRAKRFREDLYFRLNVVSIQLPPLRDRAEDILLLADHFLGDFSRNAGRRLPRLSPVARRRLMSHSWPGNVRELRNLMERLAYLSPSDVIEADEISFILDPPAGRERAIDTTLELTEATRHFQEDYIRQAIKRAGGNVSLAATQLGVHRSNLYRKMRQLGMESDEPN